MRCHQTAEAARNPPRCGDRAVVKSESVTNDVEKRWRDTHALRAAMAYAVAVAVAVVLLAAAAFVVYALGDRSQLGWAIATPGVLFGGAALGVFVKTYRDWRSPHLADPAGRGLVPADTEHARARRARCGRPGSYLKGDRWAPGRRRALRPRN